MIKHLTKLVLGLAFFSAILLQAQEPLAKKETTFKGVYDQANLLSNQEVRALSQKLIRYSDTTSTQVAIATIESLNGYDIAMLATEKAQDWGIGQQGKDNGVFILVAAQERKIHIATGYGVEHLLTDYVSKQIIDQVLTPNFKQQQYYNGFNQATDL
ncbi:MAG: TPM domain-containing protein, partial [Wenyingzhuangia sp.]